MDKLNWTGKMNTELKSGTNQFETNFIKFWDEIQMKNVQNKNLFFALN